MHNQPVKSPQKDKTRTTKQRQTNKHTHTHTMRRSKTTVEYRSGMDLDDSFRSLCKRNADVPMSSPTANASWGNATRPGPSSSSSAASRKLQLAAAMAAAKRALQEKEKSAMAFSEDGEATTPPTTATTMMTGTTKKRSLLEEVAARRTSSSVLVQDSSFSSSIKNTANYDENDVEPYQNMLLKADEINSLLNLLHTNEFAGKADPIHHSCYMGEPSIAFDGGNNDVWKAGKSPKKPPKKKIMMRSSFQSDSHLLSLKEQRKTRMIPAWAS